MGKLACRVVKTRDCYLHRDFDASQDDGICIIAEKREREQEFMQALRLTGGRYIQLYI